MDHEKHNTHFWFYMLYPFSHKDQKLPCY
jgi:hypothetical protein